MIVMTFEKNPIMDIGIISPAAKAIPKLSNGGLKANVAVKVKSGSTQ